jgi:hypothetical protein
MRTSTQPRWEPGVPTYRQSDRAYWYRRAEEDGRGEERREGRGGEERRGEERDGEGRRGEQRRAEESRGEQRRGQERRFKAFTVGRVRVPHTLLPGAGAGIKIGSGGGLPYAQVVEVMSSSHTSGPPDLPVQQQGNVQATTKTSQAHRHNRKEWNCCWWCLLKRSRVGRERCRRRSVCCSNPPRMTL